MPVIDDPAAIRFCNEQARPGADRLGNAYYFSKQATEDWFANDMASLIPNTDDLVIDGSAEDGRNQVTGKDVTNLMTRMLELISDYEAAENAKLDTVLKVAVNPARGV